MLTTAPKDLILNFIEFKVEQGKKVCKATAVRCAHCFCLLASRKSDRVIWSPAKKKSYSGELLTARTAVKIMITHFQGNI